MTELINKETTAAARITSRLEVFFGYIHGIHLEDGGRFVCAHGKPSKYYANEKTARRAAEKWVAKRA